MNKKIASFDFDNTLSNKRLVQLFCIELIAKGWEVHIVTSRYDELHKHLYQSSPKNEDLFKKAELIGIKKENIHFLNFASKADFLRDTNVLFHLDDDENELNRFYSTHKTIPINVNDHDWIDIATKIVNNTNQN